VRRALVAVLAIAALTYAAAPALAQAGVTAKLSGVSNGQTITGSVNLRGSASSSTGVTQIQILIDGSVVKQASYDGVKQDAAIEFDWATASARNGQYNIAVFAKGTGDSSDKSTASVNVDNGTSSPTGVNASHADGAVTISWNANPEPDIVGYDVERDSGSGWSVIQSVESPGYVDTPGAGTHTYRVTARRYSPTISGGRPSDPSSAVSASVPAAAAEDASGSGSGAGTGSGSGSGSGGSGVPGYGNAKNGKNGRGGGRVGTGGSSRGIGGFAYGGIFTAGGRQLGGIGLPGVLALPGGGQPSGSVPVAPVDMTFEPELPYDPSGGPRGSQLNTEALRGVAARSPWRIIPPDGLRWVAAGLWLLVTAALLRFLERRLAASEVAADATDVGVSSEPDVAVAAADPPDGTRDVGSATIRRPSAKKTAAGSGAETSAAVRDANAVVKKPVVKRVTKTTTARRKAPSATKKSTAKKVPTKTTVTKKAKDARTKSAAGATSTSQPKLRIVKDEDAA